MCPKKPFFHKRGTNHPPLACVGYPGYMYRRTARQQYIALRVKTVQWASKAAKSLKTKKRHPGYPVPEYPGKAYRDV